MKNKCNNHDWHLIDASPGSTHNKDPHGAIAMFCCPKCETFKEVTQRL